MFFEIYLHQEFPYRPLYFPISDEKESDARKLQLHLALLCSVAAATPVAVTGGSSGPTGRLQRAHQRRQVKQLEREALSLPGPLVQVQGEASDISSAFLWRKMEADLLPAMLAMAQQQGSREMRGQQWHLLKELSNDRSRTIQWMRRVRYY